MNKGSLLLLIMFSHYQVGKGQNNLSLPTGLAPEDKEYIKENKAKASAPIISGKVAGKRLPVSLDQYLPSVLDQGSQGSCTAFAVAEALSIRENYTNRCLRSSGKAQTLYSPTYLWVLGNEKRPPNEDCSKKGISYSKAFSCLFNDKLVYWNIYPYPLSEANLCHSKCPDQVRRQKIQDRKFAYDDVILDVLAFKDLLRQGYPICIATKIDFGFYDALHDSSLKGRWKKKPPQTGEQHAMLVVDYDDDIKCFKVLDSHGPNVADKGFIWISYDLVNHNLDSGVVYGCYIVSFEKDVKQGPSKSIHYTSAPISGSDVRLIASFIDSAFIGRVLDKNGNGIPLANITVKGSKKQTVSDSEGNFKLIAPSDATLVISSVGFASQEAILKYNNYTVYENNVFTTWTKEGYYRIFNGMRIGVIDLNKKNKTVLLSIKDDTNGKLLTNNIELTVGENAQFTVDDKKFSIKLTNIKHAGKFFNITNWYAAFLEYRLQSNNDTLTQYF